MRCEECAGACEPLFLRSFSATKCTTTRVQSTNFTNLIAPPDDPCSLNLPVCVYYVPLAGPHSHKRSGAIPSDQVFLVLFLSFLSAVRSFVWLLSVLGARGGCRNGCYSALLGFHSPSIQDLQDSVGRPDSKARIQPRLQALDGRLLRHKRRRNVPFIETQ